MLHYSYKSKDIQIQEVKNGDDIEIQIQVLNVEEYVPRLSAVRVYFEENDVYTDVLFYAYPNHRYSVIARKDFYVDFVLQLMKQQIITRVAWLDE